MTVPIWRKKTAVGVIGESKERCPIWITVGRGTIAEMLARHGIEPAPERERKTTWKFPTTLAPRQSKFIDSALLKLSTSAASRTTS